MAPILEKNKKPVPLSQVGYTDEKELQEILTRYPELLREETDAELLTVCKEVSMEGQFLDILMVDANGMPVAVEVKLARNGDIRRNVTGQIVEYASLLSSLTVDELDKISKGELSKTLQEFAKKNYKDFDELRKNCGANLRAGEVRIIVAVDKAHNNLAKIFDFLCRKKDLDARLVEINKFIINKNEVLYAPSAIVKPADLESREPINPFFMDVLNEYKKNELEGFPLWEDNDCPDWKWVCHPDWRELNIHYEFCDNGGEIGVEIHLEDPNMKSIQKLLQSLKSDLSKKQYPDGEIIWEPDWFEGGRLGFVFPKKTDPAVIVGAMRNIIEETSERIQVEIDKIN